MRIQTKNTQCQTDKEFHGLWIWINGDWRAVKKCQNLTFKVNFLCQKSSESFSIFFSLKNTNLGAHFLLLTFFDKINFEIFLLLK